MIYKKTVPALLLAAAVGAACSSSSSDNDGATDAGTDTGTDTGGDTTDGGTTTDGGATGGTTDDTLSIVTTLDDLSGDVTSFGFIDIEQATAGIPESGDVFAGFVQTTLDIPTAEAAESFVQQADTCEVTTTTVDEVETPDDALDVDVPFDFVSAGDNLVVSNAGGTVFVIQRQTLFGFDFYALPEDTVLPDPLPMGLSIDIPGDVFPAFSNIAIPDVDVLTNVMPAAGSPITASTTFTWDAGSNPDVFVNIDVFAFDTNTFDSISVNCIAVDDGEFSFPAGTQSELGAQFSAFDATVSRTALNFATRGDALLVIGNSSSSN